MTSTTVEQFTIEFPQPTKPVSENELRRAARSPHKGAIIATNKMLTLWKDTAFYAWKQQRSGSAGGALHRPCEVEVHVGFHQRRKRDPHNYVGTVVKSVIDGLVMAGVWPDDNPEWVTVREPVLVIHDKVPTTATLPCRVVLTPREG